MTTSTHKSDSSELTPRQAITKLVTDMTVEHALSEEFLIDELLLWHTKELGAIVTKMDNFKPYSRWYKIIRYFKMLFKALKGDL